MGVHYVARCASLMVDDAGGARMGHGRRSKSSAVEG